MMTQDLAPAVQHRDKADPGTGMSGVPARFSVTPWKTRKAKTV